MSNLSNLSEEDTTTLIELSSKGGYWGQVVQFLSTTVANPTPKQREWLETIIASLAVETNRRTARELFEGYEQPTLEEVLGKKEVHYEQVRPGFRSRHPRSHLHYVRYDENDGDTTVRRAGEVPDLP